MELNVFECHLCCCCCCCLARIIHMNATDALIKNILICFSAFDFVLENCDCYYRCFHCIRPFPDHFLLNLLRFRFSRISTERTHHLCDVRVCIWEYLVLCVCAAYSICLFDVQQTIRMCYWYVPGQITKTTFCSFRSIIDLIFEQIGKRFPPKHSTLPHPKCQRNSMFNILDRFDREN